jgi:hypothetical protein
VKAAACRPAQATTRRARDTVGPNSGKIGRTTEVQAKK